MPGRGCLSDALTHRETPYMGTYKVQSWEADPHIVIAGACSHGHGVAVQGHLQAGELALAVLQLLGQAGQVLPGAREDVQRRHARPVQAAHHALAHLLVRRAVPAFPSHAACALHCADPDQVN